MITSQKYKFSQACPRDHIKEYQTYTVYTKFLQNLKAVFDENQKKIFKSKKKSKKKQKSKFTLHDANLP